MSNEIIKVLTEALGQTLYMVVLSSLFSVVIGFFISIVLIITDDKGLKPNKNVYQILDFIINTLRSFPFLILMILIFPLSRLIVGTAIGTSAAIVPLTIGASPFAARILESAFKEVDYGIIEAAKSFGATTPQIIFKVMLKEALPSMIMGITLLVINLIGYSAMAGAIGAGGLGDVALKYGYYRFKTDIMVYTVIILIIVVQILQSLGNVVYKKMIK
jgi:D-methionine transport system permease protein